MAKKVLAMAVPDAVAVGAAVSISDMKSCSFALEGVFDATYQLEGSLDGVAWFSIGSAMADAGAYVAVDDAVQFLRVNCPSDFTSKSSASAAVSGLKVDNS